MQHLFRWCFGKARVEALGTVSFHFPYLLGHDIVLRLLFPVPVHLEDWAGVHPCQCQSLGVPGPGTEICQSSCNPRGESGACCSTSAMNKTYFPVKQPPKLVGSTGALRVVGSL